MGPDRLTIGGVVAALAASAALLAACADDDDAPGAAAKPSTLASAQTIDTDPYTIACGHVHDQQTWASVTRRATVAIGDREQIPGLTRLQATQSLFYAMTDVCKGRPASYEPAEAAVNGVRAGRYRADLGAP